MDAVNDAEQSFEASIYYDLEWSDTRLASTGEILYDFDTDKIWKPFFGIIDLQKNWTDIPELIDIDREGTVSLRRVIWRSFSLPLDLRNFPFDTQSFEIRILIESESDQVHLIPHLARHSGISYALSVPDWEVTSTTSEGQKIVVLKVEEKRRVQYYVYTMILPLLIIVLMSFTVFWIDPENFGTQLSRVSPATRLNRDRTGHRHAEPNLGAHCKPVQLVIMQCAIVKALRRGHRRQSESVFPFWTA